MMTGVFFISVVSMLLVFVSSADGSGCRIVNDCDGPAMVCYEQYGDCVCINNSCQCDGMCGPVWWLILIFCVIFLLALAGFIVLLRSCCGCCGGRKGYVVVH